MRSFIATIEIEMCIVADTQKEAQEIARKNFQNEIDSAPPCNEDFSIHIMDYIPASYEDDSLVYNNLNRDITCIEALKMNKE